VTVRHVTAYQRPARQETRLWRMVRPAMVVAGVTAATVALHVRDPHEPGSWGICPTAAVGFWCPGCGGLRAVNDLTNLRILDAASTNLVFVAAIPVLAYLFGRWTHGRWSGRPWNPSPRTQNRAVVVTLVVLGAFAVLRNLPGSWLAP
jgi:hypothetical protein